MRIVWDQAGERRYETGIDRGVLYYPGDIGGVPWNGIVSVAENKGNTVRSFYQDGIKYLDQMTLGEYRAKLRAFTYPDDLEYFTGLSNDLNGVHVHDQQFRPFHLSYRTLIGNDLDGTDHGYRLHIVYNILANPSDFAYNSLGQGNLAQPFDWDLLARPMLSLSNWAARPASHISLDSRKVPVEVMEGVEEYLYGNEIEAPRVENVMELAQSLWPAP